MTTGFEKREAAKIAAQQARKDTDEMIRNARDTTERLGALTVDEETATIWLDGEIGPDYFGCVDAFSVRDAMRTLKGREVTFRINSGGGGIDEGLEIYTILKEHRGGLVTRGNLVASMAGIIFQAGSKRIMESTGTLMIHGPRCGGGGDAAEHAKRADMLRTYAERVVPIFAERSGKSEDSIRKLLETESWFTPAQAVAHGFADEIAKPKRYPRASLAKARAALSAFDDSFVLTEYETPSKGTAALVARVGGSARPKLEAAKQMAFLHKTGMPKN